MAKSFVLHPCFPYGRKNNEKLTRPAIPKLGSEAPIGVAKDFQDHRFFKDVFSEEKSKKSFKVKVESPSQLKKGGRVEKCLGTAELGYNTIPGYRIEVKLVMQY
jgi:hypothetical protein